MLTVHSDRRLGERYGRTGDRAHVDMPGFRHVHEHARILGRELQCAAVPLAPTGGDEPVVASVVPGFAVVVLTERDVPVEPATIVNC